MGEPATSPQPTTGERPLVLFIEDNPMQRDLYAMVLEEEFDVLTATHAERGYQLALVERPDVIVVDVLLPDGDGLALCARLRAHASLASTPLVVLSGDDGALARAHVAPGLAAIIAKPCHAEALLATLRGVLGLPSAARSVRG